MMATPSIDGARFWDSNRECTVAFTPLQGYPLPMSKKKRVRVATYRHSGDLLFENSFPPHSIINEL